MTDAGEVDLGVEVSKGVVAKFLQAALGFAGTILFARILGPVEFGGFYLLLSVIDIVDKPVVGGWATATKKRFAEADTSEEAVVGSQVLFNVGMVTIVGTGAYLLRGQLAEYTGLDDPVVLLLAVMVPIVFFYPFQNLVVAKGMVGRQVGIDTFRSVLTFPLQLALVLLGLEAAGMAYGLGGATLLCLPLTYYSLSTRPTLPSKADIVSLWRFARHSIPTSMVSKVFQRYDMLLLGFLLGQAAVGDYKVALTLTVPAMFVATIAGSALMPKVSNLASRDKAIGQEVTNALAFTSVLSIPIFFGALALPRKLVVTTYGGDYSGAAVLLVGLALFRVFQTQSRPLRSAINGLDRPDLTLKISAATLGLNVVVGYLLVLEFGAVGVVVATALAELLRYALCFVVVGRAIPGIDLLPRPLFEQGLSGVVMFGAIVALRSAVPVDSWLPLAVVVVGGGAVYSAVLLAVSGQVRALATRVSMELLGTARRHIAD
jgi:O-antigen/teichoic acid export membrane protein